MKKFVTKFISVFLTALMAITVLPMSVYANDQSKFNEETINNIISEQNDDNSNNIASEIIDSRTENSKTYLMDDGTYCDVISSKQIHESETNNWESIAPQLDQLPATTDKAIELINEYAENTNNGINYTLNQASNISQNTFNFFACNSYVNLLPSSNGINLNTNNEKGVFLMKPNISELYFSNNRVINKVTVSFNVSGYTKKQEARLYCYYGDNAYTNESLSYEDLSSKQVLDLCYVNKGTTQIFFNITEIYSKWDRNTIENNGIYFGSNSNNPYTLSNPTITIEYTSCGYDDINQTYHNIDLGNAGQILINDYTNTFTLKQNLAGIDLNLMNVELTKYLTSSSDGLNSTCGPNSTINYNSSVRLYNNSLVWTMFDGSEKIFNRPVDSMTDENGFERWTEIEDTRTGINTAELNIDDVAIESEGIFTNYCNMFIVYGNSVYTFDSNGYLSQIACGDTNIQLSFSNGTITDIIDGDGNKYSLVYGSFQYNNESYTYLKKISVKDKNNVSIKYDGQNDYTVNCLYTVNEDGTVTYKTVYPNNETLEVIYDNSFNIISVKYNDIITAFEYKEGQKYISGYTQTDKDNQVISEVPIDSSNTFERIYTYITEGDKTEILDFNKLGQLISSTDKNGNQVCFGYDDYGNLCSYALEESTPNLIINGDFNSQSQWNELGDHVVFDNGNIILPVSTSSNQGLYQYLNNISADKTYVFSISGQCDNMVSSDNAFLGAVLLGYDKNDNEISIKLPLINGNCLGNQFETKKIAFKLEESLSDVEIHVVSNVQSNIATIDYVSLQEAENSSVSIDIGTPISEVFNDKGLIESETIDDGTQKLVTQYTYDASNNVSEITDQNGIKTYYAYENGKMVRKGFVKDGETIVNPVEFSYSSIGLLESVEQIIDTLAPGESQFKTEYQYKYDKVSEVTRNGITYLFDYYTNGDIKSIILKDPSNVGEDIKLIENDYSDPQYNTVINYANGYSAKIKQNNNRVSEINYTDSADNTVLKYTYSYNEDGTLHSIFDGDKIKTCFSENGFSILYKDSNSTLENGNGFREIYKKTINDDGSVLETYLSDFVDENGKPTETNITYPVTTVKQGQNTVYTQNISTEKRYSSYTNTNIKYVTNIKSVRDYFGRLAENEVDLNPSYRDTTVENAEYIPYHMNINSSYSYKAITADTNGNTNSEVTTNLISQRKDSYEFGIGDNKTIGELTYAYEYYANGKLKLISLAYEEVVDNPDLNGSDITRIVYEPISYYEYDSNGNISFELNMQNGVCLKYHYNSYGVLSERIFYNIDNCLYEDLYNFLAQKGVISSPSVEVPNPEFDIDSIPNIERTSIMFNYDGNALKTVSSNDSEGGYVSLDNDELGQLTYCVSINSLSGEEFIGKCEWTGNLLTGFETTDKRFEFTYDVNGYRTSKKSYTKKTDSWSYDNTVFYNWEDGVLQGIYLINEENVSEIVIYTDIIYDINNSPVAIQTPSGMQYLFEKDANGNVISLINPEGEKICCYNYDSFGNISAKELGDNWGEEIVNGITMLYNPCTYKGALYDYDIGMYFIQGRCYSPFLGRYLNISNYDSLNSVSETPNTSPYIFCSNDPINNSDSVIKEIDNSSVELLNNGFITEMSKAFLSRSYCMTFTNSLLRKYGTMDSSGEYQFMGMSKERIQSDLFAHSVGRYCEEAINRVNSIWGDGWLYNNRGAFRIYLNNRDRYCKKYEEIWNSAETIRKYAVNKGIYIGL